MTSSSSFAPAAILERGRLADASRDARRHEETATELKQDILRALRQGATSIDIFPSELGPWPDQLRRQLAEDGYTVTTHNSCMCGSYVHIKFPPLPLARPAAQ